jgi:glutathione S-transferase
MALKLFWLHTDPACAMVGKILDFKGLDYETVDADEGQTAETAHFSEDPERLQAKPPSSRLPTGGHSAAPAAGSDEITHQLPALTFTNGETIVGAWEIIDRLETEYPQPTVLPASHAGLHRVLARYFEGDFGNAVLRAAMPELLAYYRALGPRALSRYVLWVERRMGAGFCSRACEQAEVNRSLMHRLVTPLESELTRRAFLLGRIGLADFALYGQLRSLAPSGDLRLADDLAALREHFLRIDRITGRLQAE